MANDAISAHAITTVEDEVSTAEAIRLYKTRRRNTKARWALIYQMWQDGKTLDEIATWIGRSKSTVSQLLKRSFKERQKQPGFTWPLRDGKPVCDIPHPMPKFDDPRGWHHVRAVTTSYLIHCPVCNRSTPRGKTLMEVLAALP